MEQQLYYTLKDFNALSQEKRRELFDDYQFRFSDHGVHLNARHHKLRATLMYSSSKQKTNNDGEPRT